MTKAQVHDLFSKHQASLHRLKKYESYAYGEDWAILHKEEEPKPDNKIVCPIGKSMVTDLVGYAGRPGEIETEYRFYPEDDSKGEEDDTTMLLESFNEYNDEGLRNSQHLETACSVGVSWELWYTSDKMGLPNAMMTPEFMILNPKECFPIWNNDLKPELEAFVRIWATDDQEHFDIYYPFQSEKWTRKQKTSEWQRDPERDTKYPYSRVPANPLQINMRNEPIFKAQIPLLDSYDATYSKMKNEVDRFNAAILLLAGQLESEDKQDMREGKISLIEKLDQWEHWPEYLTKNMQGVDSYHNQFLDRTEQLIRETSKVINFQDKDFAGLSSGVALRFKLVGLEFITSWMEVYFRQGLNNRLEFYKDIIKNSTWPTVDWNQYDTEVMWKRNLPVDDKEKVEIAVLLYGMGMTLDKIIKFLPNSIVDNMSDEEIKEMLQQKQEEQRDPQQNDAQVIENQEE